MFRDRSYDKAVLSGLSALRRPLGVRCEVDRDEAVVSITEHGATAPALVVRAPRGLGYSDDSPKPIALTAQPELLRWLRLLAVLFFTAAACNFAYLAVSTLFGSPVFALLAGQAGGLDVDDLMQEPWEASWFDRLTFAGLWLLMTANMLLAIPMVRRTILVSATWNEFVEATTTIRGLSLAAWLTIAVAWPAYQAEYNLRHMPGTAPSDPPASEADFWRVASLVGVLGSIALIGPAATEYARLMKDRRLLLEVMTAVARTRPTIPNSQRNRRRRMPDKEIDLSDVQDIPGSPNEVLVTFSYEGTGYQVRLDREHLDTFRSSIDDFIAGINENPARSPEPSHSDGMERRKPPGDKI